jgi:dUTP pyrophosphatase
MQVKIKRLNNEAIIPTQGTIGSAGFDLTAISMNIVENEDYGYIEYGTGLAVAIPDHHAGLIFPRSSISNTGLILSNAVGVIDSDYRGELKFRFKYIAGTKYYNIGDRVGQLVITKLPSVVFKEVEELNSTERSDKGFGSTDDIIY